MARPDGGKTAKGLGASRFRPRGLAHLCLTYVCATGAGYLGTWIGMPLPWMLGPFFLLAAASVFGFAMPIIPMGRELGQVAIGLAVGMRFTPAVLLATTALIPHMMFSTLYVIGYTFLAAFLLKPLAQVNNVSAFFATAAGGVADMASVSREYGGDPGSVAIVHAMRVALVVAVVPFLVFFLGEQGTPPVMAATGPVNYVSLAAALVVAYLVAIALKRTPLPNPWLVGPILAGMALGVSEVLVVDVPKLLIIVAQIMLGTWLGCQFKRDLLVRLPRVTFSAVATAGLMICFAALGAVALSYFGDLPFTTSFLALAPAAVTEMVLTAKVMNLDAEIVTAFHVMRIAVVSSTVLLVFKLYMRMKGSQIGSRIQ
ncbi:AbrB family transcriptional regulator [Hoeflea sp. YIM 152468]|nr:AbrB family transcriptional regulator [Hoeflea sp. YIM 152468]MDF1608692.1 AbrB family transcriptional regulator [Hoeflea sp. YIM 152468]